MSCPVYMLDYQSNTHRADRGDYLIVFINAERRLYAIRDKVKQFRSDRGTNFVGATDDLKIRYCLEVQPTSFLTYGWCLRQNDWRGPTYS